MHLTNTFTFQNVFSFNTIFKGISMIPPANTIKVNKNTTEKKHNSWWDYDF